MIRAMRDVLIEKIYDRMKSDKRIYFISADLGAPMLDRLRADFKDRFINIGIAEQNLINVATGLALEGAVVFTYLIAPFILRAYEQIRVNLAMSSQIRPMNVNIVSLGTGLSYVVSGPTHHCIEDIAVMRVLPNMTVVSPSDWMQAGAFVDYAINKCSPKFIRLDGKLMPPIYDNSTEIDFNTGFFELRKGASVAIVTTGYMTHKAKRITAILSEKHGVEVGSIDLFKLKQLNKDLLLESLQPYDAIITMEEGLLGCGGLDSLIAHLILESCVNKRLLSFGIRDKYVFELGDRDYLHNVNGMDDESVVQAIMGLVSI
jgi:transketolase